MYYGLFVKIGLRWIRVDTTTGYTWDTAKERFANLILSLVGHKWELRPLKPVKLIDPAKADRKYAKSEI